MKEKIENRITSTTTTTKEDSPAINLEGKKRYMAGYFNNPCVEAIDNINENVSSRIEELNSFKEKAKDLLSLKGDTKVETLKEKVSYIGDINRGKDQWKFDEYTNKLNEQISVYVKNYNEYISSNVVGKNGPLQNETLMDVSRIEIVSLLEKLYSEAKVYARENVALPSIGEEPRYEYKPVDGVSSKSMADKMREKNSDFIINFLLKVGYALQGKQVYLQGGKDVILVSRNIEGPAGDMTEGSGKEVLENISRFIPKEQEVLKKMSENFIKGAQEFLNKFREISEK